MADVKGRISKAQARAQATRARLIQHAYDLFCELGYRGTTMDAIGERAGVAVQTVYFNYRTKDILLQAVHEWAVLGDDPANPTQQDWHIAAMKEPDARDALRKIITGIAEIEARVAPLIPVFHSVAQDPAGAVYRQSEERRRQDMSELVSALSHKTPLATGMTQERAADLIFFLSGPEAYRSLVLAAGWSQDDWIRWTSDTLCRGLFPPPG